MLMLNQEEEEPVGSYLKILDGLEDQGDTYQLALRLPPEPIRQGHTLSMLFLKQDSTPRIAYASTHRKMFQRFPLLVDLMYTAEPLHIELSPSFIIHLQVSANMSNVYIRIMKHEGWVDMDDLVTMRDTLLLLYPGLSL